MHLWAPEGYVALDFSKRHLTLIQPSAELRGLDVRRLDPAGLARVKEQLFGRYFQVLELDRREGDQLTAELQDFVHCLSTGCRPRVTGEDGRDAIALAGRILASIRSHSWSGQAGGPTGPTHLPLPLGALFQPLPGEAAA
jgi:hypothetical protein